MVVDASLAVAMALAPAGFGPLGSRRMAAPSLLWSEAASALRQLVWRRDVDQPEALIALGWLRAAKFEIHDSRDLMEDASRMAAQLGWAKTYDAEYIVLARRLDLPLGTADARLGRAAASIVEVIAPKAF